MKTGCEHRRVVGPLALCMLLLCAGLVLGCGSENDAPESDASEPTPDTAQPPLGDTPSPPDSHPPEDIAPKPKTLWIDRDNCRPVDHVYDPETEPLMLPCEPTSEPCDGIDNDMDGILDPKCPTVPCESDGDCTYEGLVPDADCNGWGKTGGECNQIDGVGLGEPCRGMLCPPGLKCVEGECLTPGNAGPLEACSSGADCPIHAGCIPASEFNAEETAVCKYFCQDFPCPDGFVCATAVFRQPETDIETVHSECYPADTFMH